MRITLLSLLILLPGLGCAEEACPWLNAATAAGSIGGPVSMAVTPTTCDFMEKSRASGRLHIEVVVMKDISKEFPAWLARCKATSEALKTIGNEAIACDVDGSERVIGRVREQAFLVEMKTGDRSGTRELLREKTRKIAESVAGNLF